MGCRDLSFVPTHTGYIPTEIRPVERIRSPISHRDGVNDADLYLPVTPGGFNARIMTVWLIESDV